MLPADGRPARRDASVLARLDRFVAHEGLVAPGVPGPELIEAFCGGGLCGRAPSTKGTYRSVLRRVAESERPARATPFGASPARAPYSDPERDELMAIARAPRLSWRRHSALAVLALCLGAGLRPGELIALRGSDVDLGAAPLTVAVVGGSARMVAPSEPYAAIVCQLADAARDGYLFHPEEADRTYPNVVNDFCRYLVADPAAARLSAPRCRTSFICDHLAARTDLSVLLDLAGITEVGSLLRYSVHVDAAPRSKAALRAALAAERP
jgi:integrase